MKVAIGPVDCVQNRRSWMILQGKVKSDKTQLILRVLSSRKNFRKFEKS